MHRRATGWWILAGALIAWLPGFGYGAAKSADGPGVKSAAALIVDARSGEVIYEQDAGVVTPIASITKLMTALVVLDGQQPLDEVITITAADRWKGKGAFSHIPNGTKLTRDDLLRICEEFASRGELIEFRDVVADDAHDHGGTS